MGSSGNGTTIGYSDTDGGSYTTIADVLKIGPGKRTTKDVEWTPLNDPDNHTKHASGSKNTGEYSFSLPADSSVRATLEALDDGVDRWWLITYPNGATSAGPGYINEIGEEEIAPDSLMTTAVKIMPTAKWTFTAAA